MRHNDLLKSLSLGYLQYSRSQRLPCWRKLWTYYPSSDTVIQVRNSDSEQCLQLWSARVGPSMGLHASNNTPTAWALCPTAYDLSCVPLGHFRLQDDSQSSGVTWAGLLQWNWLTFNASSASSSLYLAALGVSTVRNSARKSSLWHTWYSCFYGLLHVLLYTWKWWCQTQ